MIRKILEKYMNKESNIVRMEKFLGNISDNEEIQKFVLYETLCHHKTGQDVKHLFKTKQFLFSAKEFEEIHHLVKEQEDYLNNPIQVEDGIIECKKCHSFKTLSFAKQTRASDEGTTVFVKCAVCHHQFRL